MDLFWTNRERICGLAVLVVFFVSMGAAVANHVALTEFQKEILSDGIISPEEYKQAIQATIQCILMEDPESKAKARLKPNGYYQIAIVVTARSEQVYATCSERYHDAIELRYSPDKSRPKPRNDT